VSFNINKATEISFKSFTRKEQHWHIPILMSLGLLPMSLVNMALFHTFVELFAIGIAIMSFVVAWNTYAFSRNRFLLFLGCGYFWVGILDLLHVFTFEDVVVFQDINAGVSIQFWIVARFLEAFTLLVAPITLVRNFNHQQLFLLLGLICSLFIIAVFNHIFPKMYIPGEGLTLAKVISEYLIIAILAMAVLGFVHERARIDKSTRVLLIVSVILTIIAEAFFTLYSDLGQLPIIFGHIFKLLSFWAIYCALIESSLLRPFKSLSQVVNSYDAVSDATVIIDENGIIQQANKAVRDQQGAGIIGQHCHGILHPRSTYPDECPICESIVNKQTLQDFEFENPETRHWYEATVSGIYFSDNFSAMVHSLREITARKRTEFQFISLNRLYRVLSHTNQAIARLQNRDTLFQQICDIAVEYGGLKMAWIGIIDGPMVRPEFVSGAESGYLKKMQMRVDDSEWAKGPVGTAAKTMRVACVNNVKTDPDFEPWREAAIERDYAALAAVPLKLENQVIGLFTLYSTVEDVFDTDMLALLNNLSDDISVAIFHIEQAQQKRRAETTIRKLSSAVEQSADAVIICNTEGLIEYINPGFTLLSGYAETEALGQHVSFLKIDENDNQAYQELWRSISVGKDWRGELQSCKQNGDTFWTMLSVSPIKNESGDISHYVFTAADNTRLHEAQQTIKQLAFYDPLTKLANRRLLMDRLEHNIISASRHKEFVAVLLCDLDNFKTINDSLGHDSGDKLLQHVARILTQYVRIEDTVARLGGDEFTLVISGIKGESCVIDIASKILSELEKPVILAGNEVSVSSSIGISLYPQDGIQSKVLLRNADLAMYHAKDDGKNRFRFYQHEMNEKAQGRLALENKLRAAIKNEAFELFYQPQVSLVDGRIIGFEALIRWRDNNGVMIPPNQFIPLAEESGLIAAIGDWVIEQAFRDWQRLHDLGFTGLRMAVNVSAYQFRKPKHLCSVIKQALERHPACPSEQLTVELTESTLIEDIDDTISTLHTLKKLGLNLSIDDFGTGYSSLNVTTHPPPLQNDGLTPLL